MTQLSKIQLAKILRDSSHNYVITEKNELDNDAYFTRLKCFIEALEGSRNEAYYDVSTFFRTHFKLLSEFFHTPRVTGNR